MNRQKNKIEWGKIIRLCTVILICIVSYFWGEQERDYVKQNGVWTILTIDEINPSYKGRSLTCHYRFMGKVYKNSGRADNDIGYNDIGKRLFLQVIATDPMRILYYTEQPVPSWFTLEAPQEGWKSRPTEAELRKWQNEADSIRNIEIKTDTLH